MTKVQAILCAALLTWLPVRHAHAQCTTTNCGTEAQQLRGFEANLHVGAGGQINDSSTAFRNLPNAGDHTFWPGVGVQSTIGYRFLPYMSAGVHVGYQNNTTRDLLPHTTASMANALSAGVYLRLYVGGLIPSGRLDPWVSIGVDPYAGQWATATTVLNTTITNRFDTVAIPLTVGIDFLASRNLSLSVMGQAAPWIPWQACTYGSQGGSLCTRDNLYTNLYTFAGIGGRFTSGM